MPYFMFIAFDKKIGGAAVRAATRPDHVAYTKANGKVKFGGPFVSPDDAMIGSFSILDACAANRKLTRGRLNHSCAQTHPAIRRGKNRRHRACGS